AEVWIAKRGQDGLNGREVELHAVELLAEPRKRRETSLVIHRGLSISFPSCPMARPSLAAQEIEGPGKVSFEFFARDDSIQHPVSEQELGRLKPLRQFLADRLLDNARSCKSDERARLRDIQVAEHGEARGDAARCGVRK